jgi:hypothetical protein
MPEFQDHPGLPERQLSDCEQDLSLLRRQLALKERELQRLLVVHGEQATRIAELQAEVCAVTEAASV